MKSSTTQTFQITGVVSLVLDVLVWILLGALAGTLFVFVAALFLARSCVFLLGLVTARPWRMWREWKFQRKYGMTPAQWRAERGLLP